MWLTSNRGWSLMCWDGGGGTSGRTRFFLVATCIVVAAAGCTETSLPPSRVPSQLLSRYVSGNAAARVNARGELELATVPSPDELTAGQAQALALAYVRTFGASLEGLYSQGHGSTVHVNQVLPCGREFLAESPYQSIGSSSTLQAQRYLGAHWLVRLCESGIPVISMSVAARATELTVAHGQIVGDVVQTFLSHGIPPNSNYPVLTPEAAVRIAGDAASQRVSEVPELLQPLAPLAPEDAFWRVVLERPVTVRSRKTGNSGEARVLYVGLLADRQTPALFSALVVPGMSIPFYDLAPTPGGARPLVNLTLGQDAPASIEQVEVVR